MLGSVKGKPGVGSTYRKPGSRQWKPDFGSRHESGCLGPDRGNRVCGPDWKPDVGVRKGETGYRVQTEETWCLVQAVAVGEDGAGVTKRGQWGVAMPVPDKLFFFNRVDGRIRFSSQY